MNKLKEPFEYRYDTELIEHIWNSMPDKIKSEPFYAFFVGMMVKQEVNKLINQIFRN